MAFDNVRDEVAVHIRSIKDFPKAGINFRDVMPLFQQPKLVDKMCRVIADYCKGKNIQAVAGLEARGFLFGPQVAILLDVPFVPIRKKGKLPGKCISASYVKEYGEDVVEIQEDAVKPGWRILLVDDLLATGGTLRAAIDLIKKAHCIVAEAFVLVELQSLKGREKVPEVDITTLIAYPTE
ncbi:unnamed protein product [Auanema sp. JU1783]|nr:unnamed protein product [Auanema sp. JU1783]